jgi:transposase InsO family protein
MPRTIKTPARIRQVRQAVRRAHGPLFLLTARAHACGLLSAAELVEFQSLNKAGGERKLGIVSDAEVVLATYLTSIERLKALLLQHGEAVPDGIGQPSVPTEVRRSTDEKMLAELSATELDERAARLKVVAAMQTGCLAREALTKAKLPVTAAARRWAQRLSREYQETGRLHDGRSSGSGASAKVLTSGMRDLIEVLWMRHNRATAVGIRLLIEKHIASLQDRMLVGLALDEDLLADEVKAGAVLVPARETIRRTIQSFGKAKMKIREMGWAEHIKQMRPTALMSWANHANEEWQIDHTPLDVWAKMQQDGVWIRVIVHLTAVIDVFSRAIVGAVMSARDPDAFTTAHALRTAILPKEREGWVARGIPERLVLDNGKDFASTRVAAFGAALDIDLHYCHPRSPDEKPHIERFFGILTQELLPLLPGYKHGTDRGDAWSTGRIDKLLTVPQLRETVLDWIHDEYHKHARGESKRFPMDLWADSAVRVTVPHTRQLDILLMFEATRQVSRGVVRMTPVGSDRGIYWGPVLGRRNGEKLFLRYNPDDLASVYAYDPQTREFIGELWNIRDPRSPYSDVDVRAAWWALKDAEKTRLASLSDRTQQYFAESAAQDRLMKKRRGLDMDEARADARAIVAAPVPQGPVVQDILHDDVLALRAALAASPSDEAQPEPSVSKDDTLDDIELLRRSLSA